MGHKLHFAKSNNDDILLFEVKDLHDFVTVVN